MGEEPRCLVTLSEAHCPWLSFHVFISPKSSQATCWEYSSLQSDLICNTWKRKSLAMPPLLTSSQGGRCCSGCPSTPSQAGKIQSLLPPAAPEREVGILRVLRGLSLAETGVWKSYHQPHLRFSSNLIITVKIQKSNKSGNKGNPGREGVCSLTEVVVR